MKRTALIISAAAVLLVWAGLEWQRGRSARAGYLEEMSPFAARVLEPIGEVPDALLESSGVAVSRTQSGVLWSHNDSGDGPTLYAMDASGRLLAAIQVTGTESLDWEDIAEGPCPPAALDEDHTDPPPRCLFIADIGDNNNVRDRVSVYVVIEPRPASTGEWPQSIAASSFRYRYPDGPDDSEALAVDPAGRLIVVSKGRSGAVDIFTLSAEQVNDALLSGSVPTAALTLRTRLEPSAGIGRLVTGAAVSPNGRTLAVRTYNEVYFFDAAAAQPGAWQNTARRCALGNAEPLGEAVDFLDDDTLILTSERFAGRPGYIHRVEC